MTLWTPCIHGFAHFVDLTWGGAWFTLACFLVGWALGRWGRTK